MYQSHRSKVAVSLDGCLQTMVEILITALLLPQLATHIDIWIESDALKWPRYK